MTDVVDVRKVPKDMSYKGELQTLTKLSIESLFLCDLDQLSLF